MTALLEAKSISFARGARDVVRDVNVIVAPGDVIAIVGANGAGKSTLLKCLAGLLAPRDGVVTSMGEDIAGVARRELATRIAYLPQDRTVHWSLAAERVVALGRLPHRAFAAGESQDDRAAIRSAMQRMDVMQFAQRPIATLSGGEQGRVLIARALAQDAHVIIADEPSAGLDPAHSLKLFAEFVRMASEQRAVVVALHDLSFAARYATRIVVMKQGRCIANGPPAQALSKAIIAEAFAVDALVTQVGDIPVILPASPLT